MPAVPVVGSARPFGGNHGRTQRILRSAAHSECRAIRRFLESLKHLCTNTLSRFFDTHVLKIKNIPSIEIRKLSPQPQAALRDGPDAAPLLVGNLESLRHNPLRLK